MSVAIVFPDFGPYHVARIEALGSVLGFNDKLTAIRFSEQSGGPAWKPVLPKDIEVVTLAQRWPATVGEAFKTALLLGQVLRKQAIEIVFLPSYSPLPNLLCVLIAKLVGCKAILMNESWHGTEKAGLMGRMAKHIVVRSFDAALVGGTPQKVYAHAYGQKQSNIFFGYDVVDTNYYVQESKRWREGSENLPIANLPHRYFLNLGRFVPKKNIDFLVRAYAHLYRDQQLPFISLVLVGEGSEENVIRQVAIDSSLPIRNGFDSTLKPVDGPEVVFYPFQQVDKTPLFFARCEAFILPSLHEEWGLVINEAMACGSAVLVSKNVGCAQDLIEEGKNGFQFDPTNVAELSGLLRRFIDDPTLATRLGQHGVTTIRQWGPDRFAEGALNAIRSVSNKPVDTLSQTDVEHKKLV